MSGDFDVRPRSTSPSAPMPPAAPNRASLIDRLTAMAKERVDAPMVIGGERVTSTTTFPVAAPHSHTTVLADVHAAGRQHITAAIDTALAARHDWSRTPFEDRAAILLRAAELLAGGWRDTLNAATMLGQSKTVFQAEIDSACELIDFWRFNVAFAANVYAEQPESAPGMWNRMEHRPLEGFVLALTPFNFTAIAGNLPTAPALMGNVVVWKPSEKQAFAAQLLMELLEAAASRPASSTWSTGTER